jgi:hypothetical protein
MDRDQIQRRLQRSKISFPAPARSSRSCSSRCRTSPDEKNPGDSSGEATPVPIPNTEVKLSSAEDTQGVAPRENRSSPGSFLFTRPVPPGFLILDAPRRQMRAKPGRQRWQPRQKVVSKPPADTCERRVPQRGHALPPLRCTLRKSRCSTSSRGGARTCSSPIAHASVSRVA